MSTRRTYADPCGVARGLDVIGDRWALLVVRDLLLGPKRFNDLLGGLPGVSPNVLTQRLRDLVEHGVVHRQVLAPPARVHLYELTDWGRALEPVLLQLGRWGSQAPLPPEGDLGVDSLLLSLKAGFDPTRASELAGVYELRVDADTYVVDVTDHDLLVRRGTTDQNPDASLATDIDTLRAVCDGQTTPAGAIAAGVLRLDGGREARTRLTALVSSASQPPG